MPRLEGEDFVASAIGYACDVVDGEIDACQYVRQSCQRMLDDVENIASDEFEYYLDRDRANAVCAFIETLKHVKGKWAKRGARIELEPWQCFIVVNIFGWLHKVNGYRRFMSVYIEVPRKNGKSVLAAAIGLAMLVFDEEFGAEVYCGATTEKQAWEVFRPARWMVERDTDFRIEHGVKVNAKSLVTLEDGSRFEPMIGDPGDGSSPSLAIVDEYHEHVDDRMYDTMQTGMMAREQPMMFVITTAGANMGGPCFELRSEMIKVLQGSIEEERNFALIYTLDLPNEHDNQPKDGDDWTDFEVLKKCNPNYGISVLPHVLESAHKTATQTADKQSAFLTKHCNIWVGAMDAWMNMVAYQRQRKKELVMGVHRGEDVVLGLDLATRSDIASLAYLFPIGGGRYRAFCRHYLPESAVYGAESQNDRYKQWVDAGYLTTTPGNRTDFEYIKKQIREDCKTYNVRDVCYDPFQATQLAGELFAENIPMVEYGATIKNFSEPMKHLDTLVATGMIDFAWDPVLMWMFSNVVAYKNTKEDIMPRKEQKKNKIDGVVALIMALGRVLLTPDTTIILPDDYEVPTA